MWIIDFETEAIEGNTTVRPPVPVGMAYKRPGYKSRYMAWGHLTGNNCTFEDAASKLRKIWADKENSLLFHNAKFDLSVAQRYFHLPEQPWERIHDTLFLVFLHNPYAESLSLKPSAETILGIPPDEQDLLRNWILTHVPEATEKNWGAHISEAPAHLVAPYACGDVDRTWRLYEYLIGKVPTAAYDRERKLLKTVMRSERKGVKLAQGKLERDMAALEESLELADQRAFKILGKECNLDSGVELAAAVDSAGLAGEWVLTPTGKRSTARDNLMRAIAHPELLQLLVYRGAVSHCLSNFGRPWIAFGKDYNGRLHPDWSQVRQPRDDGGIKGTRTGRLSGMKPNFMNMPNEYDIVIPTGLEPLPLMRRYLIPDTGMVWMKRDYSQQELRILAHFSEGRLYERYKENPRIDAHTETASLIQAATGLDLPRKSVKITGFSIIYGAGITQLASQLKTSYAEAQSTRSAYFTALPEIQPLMKACAHAGRTGDFITTWGGRTYYVEPSRMVKGRMVDFSYKLLNYLIQGSGADCTKEAINRWGDDPGEGEFLVTVHDEIDGQAPKESLKPAMKKLQKAMESIEFDVPMLSDGFYGNNWADLKEMS